MTKKITIAPQDTIDAFEKEAELFFATILNMDYHACLVTDESDLSDFSSCGLPEDFPDYESLEDLYNAWDTYILEAIEVKLHLSYDRTTLKLIHIFKDMFQQTQNKTVH